MKIWIVDAFTTEPYKGNPAAVTIVNDFPDDETCLKIAAEMNLSETAFLKPMNGIHYKIRWFTPKAEVKLCGHATLASAHIIRQENLVGGREVMFHSADDTLRVTFTPSVYTLDFPLAKSEEEVVLPVKFPEATYTGKIDDDVLVELPSDEQVKNYVPVTSELEKIDCRGVIITSKDSSGKYDFISRFFSPKLGINEDPVTGSAHCKLALYWKKRLNKSTFFAYQASARGGEIRVSVAGDRVQLTGRAVTVLSGEWLVKV